MNQSKSTGYIPTLDGWRAIAVLSVIAYHGSLLRVGGLSDNILHSYGYLGVDLFFAISGLLICKRLLEEEEAHGNISLKGFYIRRFFRILPPAFAFLIAVGTLRFFHVIQLAIPSWFCSLFFVNNYYMAAVRNPDLTLYTNHLWSLAVEEHFYLLLPAILFFVRRRRLEVLTALTAVSFIYSIAIYAHHSWWLAMGNGFSRFRTDMRIHALLFPALIALLLRRTKFRRFCTLAVSPLVVIVFQLIAFQVFPAIGLPSLFLLIVPCGFPFLVVGTMLHPTSPFSRFLEIAPMRFLGRISYSIYLWQQLYFIDQHENLRAHWPLGPLQSSYWSLPLVVLIAVASYYLLERPLIRLGHRLAPPATPGRIDLGEEQSIASNQAENMPDREPSASESAS